MPAEQSARQGDSGRSREIQVPGPFEEGSVLVQSGRSQNERLWNGRF